MNVLVLLLVVICAIFYFSPTLIAYSNKSNRIRGIFILNLLLGWSGIGWIIAIIWAVSSNKENKRTIVATISNPTSVADELNKLNILLKDKIITQDEFENQKRSLLNK